MEVKSSFVVCSSTNLNVTSLMSAGTTGCSKLLLVIIETYYDLFIVISVDTDTVGFFAQKKKDTVGFIRI